MAHIHDKGIVLFNDALNTFYLRLCGVRHMVENRSDSEKGNPMPPRGLGALDGTRNSSMGPPRRIDPTTHRSCHDREVKIYGHNTLTAEDAHFVHRVNGLYTDKLVPSRKDRSKTR